MRFIRTAGRALGRLRRPAACAILAWLALCSGPAPVFAEGTSRRAADAAEQPIVERARTLRLAGRTLRYVSRAGRLPIVDDATGQVQAWMFFTAYVAERPPGAPPRPLTFLWNGGPGANAALVHLAGLGPRRIVVPDNPPHGEARAEVVGLVDNPDSWLADSDLVFVDPVGTGFSRATSVAGEPAFLSTLGDAESVAEFIRGYRDRFRAWDQPLIQGGESYGVTRAAWVAETLLRRGLPLAGVVLLNWDIPLGAMPPAERHALALPTYAAAAFYHRRLDAVLQADFQRTMDEVTAWSRGTYLDAVRRADRLPDVERRAVVATLSRYTGLRRDHIDRRTLRIDTGTYSGALLADRGLLIGRYDSRFVARAGVGAQPPALAVPEPNLVERYLREEIGYDTPLRYAGGLGAYGLGPPGDRREVGDRWTSESTAIQDAAHLEAALRSDPRLQIIDMCGYFDLGANCIGDQQVIDAAGPTIARRVTLRRYAGGHAPYLASAVRPLMQRDFAAFVRSVIARPAVPRR